MIKNKKDKPQINLPSFTINDKPVKAILKAAGFTIDDKLVNGAREFIRSVDFTTQIFNYNHHEVNLPIIRDYNKKVRDLSKNTSDDLRNITALTIHVRKGKPITFYNDSLSGHLIKKLFGEPRPDMSLNPKGFNAQVNYLTSTKIVMPVKEYKTTDKDQLFVSIVKDAVPLGKMMFGEYTKKKSDIRKLVMALLNQFFPNIEVSEATEKQTFKTHFNSKLG